MSDVSIKALDLMESIDAGLKPFTDTGHDPNDNPLVESLLTGRNAPRYDARGRLVISFRQYKELQDRNAQMSGYALEMTIPSKPHIRQIVPAAKYLKHWGNGMEVVGAPLEETHVYADTLRYLRMQGLEQGEAIAKVKKLIADRNRVAQAPTVLPAESNLPDDVTLFFCRDKYPDCKRVFDNARGLSFHWRNDHGEAPISKAAKAKFSPAPEPTEEVSEE